MPLIVCLYRCAAARHGAGARSITFCSASATCDHQADELIDLKVDVPGGLMADFELVFVQEARKKSLRGSFLRARRGTFCREPARALLSSAQSQCPHRGHHTHRARPPAPRSLLRRPPVIFVMSSLQGGFEINDGQTVTGFPMYNPGPAPPPQIRNPKKRPISYSC